MKPLFTAGYPHILIIALMISLPASLRSQIYKDPSKPADVRTEDLLSQMTLEEKIGQMTQAERVAMTTISDIKTYFIGSLLSGGGSAPASNTGAGWADMSDNFQKEAMNTRLGIPLIYGIDAVHGHNNVKDAVIFPHNIGLGATRNPLLVKQAAQITAKEIIATGLHWTFAPCIAVPRNERWGRTYEGFGEVPELVTEMGVASVVGLQGDSLNGRQSILACAKHYIADGGTTNGADQGNAQMDEQMLRKIHLPAYIDAVKHNAGSVMASYSSWNGLKMHAHKYLLTDVLKTELGFKGFVVSDWAAIDQLSGDYAAKVEASVNAGVDMIMLPYNYKEFTSTLKSLVTQGRVSQARIDDAVRRILKVKFQMGLFEKPYADRSQIAEIGSDAHRAVARECVRQSLVLLKRKDNVLPLLKSGMKIHLAGKNADNIGNQCGGWTISWQGSGGNITKGTSILQAIKNTVITSNVTFSADGTGAAGSDVAVAVIGETPYAEGNGDRVDLSLSAADVAVVRNLKKNNIPVIALLVSGRPMLLNQIQHYCDAVIAAWLPGSEGQGVADVLFGDYQPTGKLPHSWPKEMSQIPINFGDAAYAPLYEYGYGISGFANPPAGSAPAVLSALVSADGGSIELMFSKTMADPSPDDFSRFKITVNSIVGPFITKAEISSKDKTVIILTPETPLQKGDRVIVSYSGGNVAAADGGKLMAFSNMLAYNLMNEFSAQTIPGKIEAENYSSMSGIQTEATTDAGGGQNVGYIEAGDWMEYYINVPATGTYNFNFRIAAQTEAGQIIVKMSDTTVATVNLPATGGWQVWRTQSAAAGLTKGQKYIRLLAGKGGFNINWFEVASLTRVDDNGIKPEKFSLLQNYPNPFNPVTTIAYSIPERSDVKLAVYDLLGRQLAVLVNEEQASGSYSVTFDAASCGLSSGIYFYSLTSAGNTITRKLSLMK